MINLLRISDAAALALHTVEYLGGHEGRFVTTQEIADALSVSEHHLAKVHQRLARAGIIQSVRGPSGGSHLNRDPGEIALMDVFEAIEGPFVPNQCLLGRPRCQRETCLMGAMVCRVNDIVREFFEKTTVAQLIEASAQMTGSR